MTDRPKKYAEVYPPSPMKNLPLASPLARWASLVLAATLLAAPAVAVDKADDALRGPLTLTFAASKGRAKFNTVKIKDQAGVEVVAFGASDLADAFSRAAMVPPEVKEPAIWRDATKPLRARAADLIKR